MPGGSRQDWPALPGKLADEVRLATYNVLATAYIRASYYPEVEPRWLDPAWRHPAVVRRVQALEADVLCLQEVEAGVYAALREALPDYVWNWLPKSGGRPDGCATAARTVLSTRELVYADGSGHVALLTEVAPGLVVANTHLKWHQGLPQITELLRLNPQVVCGDLNVTSDDPVLKALCAAGFKDDGNPAPTAVANGKAKKIDHVFSTLPMRAEPPPRVMDHTPLPSAEEPSDHLPLVVQVDFRLPR